MEIRSRLGNPKGRITSCGGLTDGRFAICGDMGTVLGTTCVLVFDADEEAQLEQALATRRARRTTPTPRSPSTRGTP